MHKEKGNFQIYENCKENNVSKKQTNISKIISNFQLGVKLNMPVLA